MYIFQCKNGIDLVAVVIRRHSEEPHRYIEQFKKIIFNVGGKRGGDSQSQSLGLCEREVACPNLNLPLLVNRPSACVANTHYIKMKMFWHYQVFIFISKLQKTSCACRSIVEFGVSKTFILVDIYWCNFTTERWNGMYLWIHDVYSILN